MRPVDRRCLNTLDDNSRKGQTTRSSKATSLDRTHDRARQRLACLFFSLFIAYLLTRWEGFVTGSTTCCSAKCSDILSPLVSARVDFREEFVPTSCHRRLGCSGRMCHVETGDASWQRFPVTLLALDSVRSLGFATYREAWSARFVTPLTPGRRFFWHRNGRFPFGECETGK
jgi:hypothetical protein